MISVLVLGVCFAAFPGRSPADTPSGWYQQTSGVSGELTSVSAVNKTTAWAGGTDGLLKTTDGGATWKRQPLDFGTLTPCVYAVNSQVVWAAGGNVYRTTNGGATWEIVLQGTGSVHSFTLPIAVAATDSNTAWVRNLNYVNIWGPTYWCDIVKTEDGGTTWSLPQASGAMAMAGLCAVDRSTAWAASIDDSNHPLITKTSLGAGWKTQFCPTTTVGSVLTSIDAPDGNNAWAVGGSFMPPAGVILHTSDGGIGWQSQDSHAGPSFTGVSAVDAKTAWAVGWGGTIVKTTDGENWAPQASGVTTSLNAISAVDSQTAWAVGAGGVILHTVDGGGAPVVYPDLQSVALNEGETGVIIRGSGFGSEPGSMEIDIGRVEWDYGYPVAKQKWLLNNYTSWSDEEIRCVLPTTEEGISPGVYEVVLKSGNLTSSRRFFALGQFSAVTSITPYSGADNSTLDVTMTGYGFGAPNLSVQVSNATASIPVTDVVVVSPTQLTCKLDLAGRPVGKYDVRVGGDYPVFVFLNGFTVLEPSVSKITPNSGPNLWAVPVSISGLGFLPGATVRIESGSTVINATDVAVKSGSLITSKLDLKNKPLGKYDVFVTNPDGSEGKLAGGFTVTNACGQGAAISVSLFAGLLGLLSAAGLGWRRKRFKA